MKNKHLSKIVSTVFIAAMIFNIIPFAERKARAALIPGGAVGPVVPSGLGRGFPAWYMDQNGLAIELCAEPNNLFCLADPRIAGNPFSE